MGIASTTYAHGLSRLGTVAAHVHEDDFTRVARRDSRAHVRPLNATAPATRRFGHPAVHRTAAPPMRSSALAMPREKLVAPSGAETSTSISVRRKRSVARAPTSRLRASWRERIGGEVAAQAAARGG